MSLTKTEEFEAWTKGDLVRVKNEDGVFRFQAHVTNSKGEQWVDVYGPLVPKKVGERKVWDSDPSGAEWRSFNTDRIVDIKTKTSSRTESGVIKGDKRMATPQQCLCGCNGETKGGRFIPGHDARMKGVFIREYREASTEAARAKVTKAVEAINPAWTKYLTDTKPKAEPKAKAPAKAKRSPAPVKKVPRDTSKGSARAQRTAKRAAAKSA